jgi:hypothetical protein
MKTDDVIYYRMKGASGSAVSKARVQAVIGKIVELCDGNRSTNYPTRLVIDEIEVIQTTKNWEDAS